MDRLTNTKIIYNGKYNEIIRMAIIHLEVFFIERYIYTEEYANGTAFAGV